MKNRAKRISVMAVGVFACALCLPAVTRAQQESKPAPEAPQPESPRNDPPPSPPAEAPRNDPPPSPPAEAPRNDPPPSPPSGGGGSNNNDNSGSRNNDSSRSRDNDSGRRNTDNDNRRNIDNGNRRNNDDNNRRGNEKPASGNREVGGGIPGVENPTVTTSGGGNRSRGSMTGDGSGNRRDRTIETEDGQIVPGGRGTVPAANSGGTGGSGAGRNGNAGAGGGTNPGGGRGGGNSGGGGNDRHRDHGRDGDRHGRHRGRDGHRHYRGDECYQVPAYDDTISYSSSNYPVYDPDDSLSAYDRGYNDGLYTGANDGRRGQIYDPERSHFYKSADHGYRSIKGPRDIYRQAYRDGFLRGYREGFQDWRHYFVNGTFIRR